MLSLQAVGDGGWQHWALPLSSENLKGAQLMRSPVLVICTSRKTQVKPPHAGAQSSHSLHTATCPQTSHQQHLSILRLLHRRTRSTTHSAGAWQHGHCAVPNRTTPPLLQSHKATGTTQTPGLPCRPLPISLGSLLSETKPWPPAPQGDKPVQVLDTVGSLQFPLSTTSLHTCVPLIHTWAGNSGMTQMMRLSVLIMGICECNLHSLASEASLSFCHPFCALSAFPNAG